MATPYRELLMWLEWVELQWNNPSLTDYYLMQVAQRVDQTLVKGKDRSHLKLEDQKLVFKRVSPPPLLTEEEKEDMAKEQLSRDKAIILAAVGYRRSK